MSGSFRTLAARVSMAALVGAIACGEEATSPEPLATDNALAAVPAEVASATSTCSRKISVNSVSALSKATSSAVPGDCIVVSAGTYPVGVPRWTRSGTASKPITLEGAGKSTVFTLGGNGGIYLTGSYWRVRNLRVTSGLFGIQTEGAKYVELDNLEIDNMMQAAINLRYGTNNSVVKNSKIHDTGKSKARYGEGVYIGGYASYSSSSPDNAADDNQVLNNTFGPNVRAEAVDISRGADRVTIAGNSIDGKGTVSEYGAMNSLIGIRGAGHQISDNVLSKGAPYGVDVYEGSATFHRNRISLQSNGMGIRGAGGSITVYCDNAVTDIKAGGKAYSVACRK